MKMEELKYEINSIINNQTLFRYSVITNQIEVVKTLIMNGVDIHANDEYALRIACEKGYYEIVKILIEAGANIHVYEDTPFVYAVCGRHFKLIDLLIQSGANINTRDNFVFKKSYKECNMKMYNYLLSLTNKRNMEFTENNNNKRAKN